MKREGQKTKQPSETKTAGHAHEPETRLWAAVRNGPSVSGAAGSVCPQVEELQTAEQGYKAVVRERKGKSGDGHT